MSYHGFHPGARHVVGPLHGHPGVAETGEWRCVNCNIVAPGMVCPLCGAARPRYSTRSRSKDDDLPPPPVPLHVQAFPTGPQHTCGVCNRTFTTAEHLKHHLSGKTHQQQLAAAMQELASDVGEEVEDSDSDSGESDEEHNNKTAATDFAKAVFVGAEAAQAWSAYVAEQQRDEGPPAQPAKAAEPEPESERSEGLQAGARVMARYSQDRLFYPATIAKRTARRKGCVAVDFDDGDRRDVPVSDIHFPQNLDIGQEVLAHPEETSALYNKTDYFPGRVVDNSDARHYMIEFYDKSILRCLRSRVIVRDFPSDEMDFEEMPCNVCGRDNPEDDGILCDACNGVYHFTCVDPPITSIPEGAWFCPACLRSRAAAPPEEPCPCGALHATPSERLACTKAPAPLARAKPLPIDAIDSLAAVLWRLLQSLRAGGPVRGSAPLPAQLAALSVADFAAENRERLGAEWKPLLHRVLAEEAAVAKAQADERRLMVEAEKLLQHVGDVQRTLGQS